MSSQPPEDERQREARAILERIRRETEPQIGAHTEAIVTRTRDHFMGRDADAEDRFEVIGTRIGRIASVLAFVILAVLLASQLLSG
ncbi:hypothetical protein LQ948_04890 [Jiella sp. MQZ9-1]|uniref:Uncharacterized protein n=1 Tax=Jiella flava TaxID=2816857 RepID=A0A939FZC0_9HYPH|nr:hypothetical protein [Jiella flava]MBO0662129.1 hypothetical protein [Jiella flava]MCD2470542.1 hypothetical protein [Jiella flava]